MPASRFTALVWIAVSWAGVAQADLEPGDPIFIFGQTFPQISGPVWGTSAPQGPGDNGLPHPFGGTSTYADSISGPFFSVEVTSAATTTGGTMTVDYSAFAPFDFTTHVITCMLKSDGTIASVTLEGVGAVTPNPNGFTWSGSGPALAFSPILTFTWVQPGPASLALLGAAGLVGRRRR